ncbi:protein of unknown function (DUF1790) [Cylindrospermum stagnale PCC 7417]|uniref:Uncharacterized protein n=1 Tax=Cylindrospermum stagnale PCC 7417 TaxID=56107 RepID=K9X3Q8_9NOST|nr:YbjN domain-containing protein [Cylindrospermum stagnale]AFZ26691.1 protein of unknown function (DUF1790) [Cylindrospermum stagnale PCC 7417]
MVIQAQKVISENLTNFFQSLLNRGFDYAIKESNPASIGEIASFFRELSETSSKISSPDTNPNQPIFNALLNFFRQDNWQFQQLKPEPVLRIPFQGKNGNWNCYAKAREIQQHFVFYSICPITAPESKREAIAEFITRVNYDMIIGNFELEFSVGEIRYKTSVDVKDERLSFKSIKHLVYTNVNMMDKYLPGIISVIAGDILPTSAINQIEPNSSIYQSSDKQEELAFNSSSSSQPDIQQQEKIPERKSHILARLTPDEIGQLHQALQVLEPYQRKQTQAIIEKVKRLMIARLDDLGTEVFDEAFTLFKRVKFPAIILKLIQRYSRMGGQTRLFIQQLQDWVKQSGEVADNSDINLAIEDLEELFGKINKRLEELPTDKLLGEKELIYLIEIEQFREQLAFFTRFIKDIE